MITVRQALVEMALFESAADWEQMDELVRQVWQGFRDIPSQEMPKDALQALVALRDGIARQDGRVMHQSVRALRLHDEISLDGATKEALEELERHSAQAVLARRASPNKPSFTKKVAFELLGWIGDQPSSKITKRMIVAAFDDAYRRDAIAAALERLESEGFIAWRGTGRARYVRTTDKGFAWRNRRRNKAFAGRMKDAGQTGEQIAGMHRKMDAKLAADKKRWAQPKNPAGSVQGGMTTTPAEKSIVATLVDKLTRDYPDATWSIGYTGGEFYAQGEFGAEDGFAEAVDTLGAEGSDNDFTVDEKNLVIKVFSGQTSGNP